MQTMYLKFIRSITLDEAGIVDEFASIDGISYRITEIVV